MESWISSEYEKYYENIKKHVEEISLNKGVGYFTPHDNNHCYQVERIVKELVEKSRFDLSNTEKFILLCAVWTHDLGMYKKVAEECEKYKGLSDEEIREKHDEISAHYLKKKSLYIFGLDKLGKKIEDIAERRTIEKYINTINIISKYHRRKEDIYECPEERFIEGQKINTRLLGCFLRLGDTLHVDSSRFDRELYDILQIGSFDRSQRLHWLKSYVVSNLHIDDKKMTIFVNIDLPELKNEDETSGKYNINELKEGYKKLAKIIKEDIYEDVIEVNDVFRDYDLPTYTKVEPLINYIAGYGQKEYEEIIGMVLDLEIILSPNDSSVIKKTFDSIKSLCKIGFGTYEEFYNATEQLIRNLEITRDRRTCHVGLGKIIDVMEGQFDRFSKDKKSGNANLIKNYQKSIREEIESIEADIKKSENEVYNNCKNHLTGKKYIFVSGFSSMVSNFIYSYAKDNKDFMDNVNIYVLEFGGRRRFLHHNFVDYNDGIEYSLYLKNKGFSKINLLSDTSFASLLHEKTSYNISNPEITPENSLTLFGANGIDADGNCWHSSGHLMVAMISKCFKVPVKIVANTFKKGDVKWKASELRKTNWLTGQKNILKELESNNIHLINYLEDKIPKKFYDEVIIR